MLKKFYLIGLFLDIKKINGMNLNGVVENNSKYSVNYSSNLNVDICIKNIILNNLDFLPVEDRDKILKIMKLIYNYFVDLKIYDNLKKEEVSQCLLNLKNNEELQIIIIRGIASSGKSSVSKEFIKINYEKNKKIYPYFTFEDFFLFVLLDKEYLVDGKDENAFSIERDKDGNIISFHISKFLLEKYLNYQNVLELFIKYFDQFVIDGNFINIEDITLLIKKIAHFAEKNNRKVKIDIVSLKTPLNIAIEREKKRDVDRTVGFSNFQFKPYENSLKNMKSISSNNNNIEINKNIIISTEKKNPEDIVKEMI